MNLKRVFAGVAAAATMLGGLALVVTTANAVDADQLSSTAIRVNNSQAGHTYTAYKFATFTPTTVDGTQYVAADTVNNEKVKQALSNALGDQNTIPNNPAAAVAGLNNAQLRAFAQNLSTDGWPTGVSATSNTTGSPIAIESLTEGWYVVTDTWNNGSESEKGVNAIVATKIGMTSNFTIKTPHEQGQMNITQAGEFNAKNATGHEDLAQVAEPTKTLTSGTNDVSAGDVVSYEVRGTIPAAAAGFSGYTYKLTDTPESGIKILDDPDITVTVGGKTVEGIAPVLSENVLTVTIEDAAQYAGEDVVVEYSAKITKDIDNETVNVAQNNVVANGMYLDLNGNKKESSAAATPVVVQTNDFTLQKVDASNNPLTGAKFTIARDGKTGSYNATTGEWNWTGTPAAGEITEFSPDGKNAVFNFSNLAAGIYTFKETAAPTGYQTYGDGTFTVTVTRNHSDKTTSLALGGGLTSMNGLGLVTLSQDGTTVIVKNVQNVTQLPLTGAAGITMLIVVALLLGGAAALIGVRSHSLKRQLTA